MAMGEEALWQLLQGMLPGMPQSTPYYGMGTEFGRPTGPGGGYEGYFKQPQFGFPEMITQMLGRQMPTPRLEMPGRYRMQMDMMNRFRQMNWEMQAYSPTFDYVMTQGLGRMTGQSFQQTQQQIANSTMLNTLRSAGSRAWNMFVSPYTDQYQQIPMMASEAYRQFAAVPIQGPSGKAQLGFNYQQSRQFAQQLYESTRGPSGLFQQGPFNPRDMMEIASISQAYGGFTDLGKIQGMSAPEEMVRRTKDIAKVIDVGMRVYGEMDKQKVVEKIMELTRGTIGLQNTGAIETLLHRVDSMARTANLSVDLMQKIAAEGADIARRVNVRGNVGAVQAMQAVATAQAATAGPGGLVSQSMTDFLGGQNQVTRMMAGLYTGFMQSPTVRDIGGLIGAGYMNEAGGEAMMAQGISPFNARLLQYRMAQRRVKERGLPQREVFAELARMRNPRLQMEGQSRLLERLQEDPVNQLEVMLTDLAASLRGNMTGSAWDFIMSHGDRDTRESMLYQSMMRQGMIGPGGQILNASLAGAAGGDPQNVVGVAGMLADVIPQGWKRGQLPISETMRQRIREQARTTRAATMENIYGLQNMEQRSLMERFINTMGGPDVERGMFGATLEAILPEQGRLDTDVMRQRAAELEASGGYGLGSRQTFYAQAMMTAKGDLTDSQRTIANSMLGASKYLLGGMDITKLMDKGSEENEKLKYMSAMANRFSLSHAAEGEKLLTKAGITGDVRKQLQRQVETARGIDAALIADLQSKGLGGLSGAEMADALAALGATPGTMSGTRQMLSGLRGYLKDPEYQELKKKLGSMTQEDRKNFVLEAAEGLKKTAAEVEKARKEDSDKAVKGLDDYVTTMKDQLGINVGQQYEDYIRLSGTKRVIRDKAATDAIKTIIGKDKTTVKEKIAEWTKDAKGVGDVIAKITASIKTSGLGADEIKALQEYIPQMARYAIQQGMDKDSAAYKEMQGMKAKRESVKEATTKAYEDYKAASEAYKSVAGMDKEDVDWYKANLEEKKKAFEATRSEFAKYGPTEKELEAFKDLTPGFLEQLVKVVQDLFDWLQKQQGQGGVIHEKGTVPPGQ